MNTKLKIEDLWVGAKVKTSDGNYGVVCVLDNSNNIPVRVDSDCGYKEWYPLNRLQLVSKPRFVHIGPRKMTKDEIDSWSGILKIPVFCRHNPLSDIYVYSAVLDSF